MRARGSDSGESPPAEGGGVPDVWYEAHAGHLLDYVRVVYRRRRVVRR